MPELPAHALYEVLIRVEDSNSGVLSLVCTSWRSVVKGCPHLTAATLVRQLLGRVIMQDLSQDPPVVDIVSHLSQSFNWESEATVALGYACHNGLTDVVELLLTKGAKLDGDGHDNDDDDDNDADDDVADDDDDEEAATAADDDGDDDNGDDDGDDRDDGDDGDDDGDKEVDSSKGCSPLYLTCRRGHISVARMLVGRGATVQPGDSWRGKGPQGRSALHAACEGGYPDIAKLLLESGADVNYADGRTASPLHIACTVYPGMNEMNTVTTSPSQFASMAVTWYQGEAEVQAAAKSCNADRVALVALLVVHGADVSKLDGRGLSPLYLACSHGLLGVVELLVSHGVDVNLE
jgi:ankyrin repeat protein